MRSGTATSYSDIADQLSEISALSASMSSATASAAAKMARGYTQAFDQIGAGWKRVAAGLLEGTMTWQQAGVAATRTVEAGFVSLAETALSQAAAGPLATLLGLAAPAAGQGVGSVLGSGLGGLIGKQFGLNSLLDTGDQVANTAALSTNTAALTALATTMAAGTAAAGGGAAAAGASAAATAGGAVAGGGGLFGWLGGLLAFSKGGIVPSAARGWALPSFAGATPALLHSREMVLPAPLSEGLQSMIAQGGNSGDMHLHFHGPSDGPAVERWFTGLMGRNPGVVRNMLRSNALTPRTI
jgi:hypothetical protein